MDKLKSRKLWAAVIGALLVALNDQLGWGFESETIYGFVGIIITYILGQAHVDGRQGGNASEKYPISDEPRN